MQTQLFIKNVRTLTAEINSAVNQNASVDEFQEQIDDIASDLRNPTLVCLKYLVEAAKKAGLNPSSVKSKFIYVDYSN
jgi:hypothetical protein